MMDVGNQVRDPGQEREVAELLRCLDRCRRTVDRAISQRTIPTKLVQRPRFHGRARVPSVDDAVWLDHVALHVRHDSAARDRLVSHYESHARALARRSFRQREPLEDLEQVAMEGLLLALERFDPTYRKPFLGFANPTIVGSLRRHYRDTGWSVRVPRRVHDMASTMRDTSELLTQDLGRAPTGAELADMIGISPEEVAQAQVAMSARSTDSIDAPAGERSPGDLFGQEDGNLGLAENWVAVQQALVHLSNGDRELLQLYFMEELTQTQIAERVGVSQMHVSRSISRVLRQLRSHLRTD